jgi:protein TonB
MRISLSLSLLFHVGLALAIHGAFPMKWFAAPMKTYHVELLRPPLDLLKDDEGKGTDLARIKPAKEAAPEETEDTISLDTKDKRYVSYAKIIKERLMQHWVYPPDAKDKMMEGRVLVIFSLNRKGQLLGIRVVRSSTHLTLDQETVRTIRTAAPFPSFPGSVKVTKLHIKANFAYRLAAQKQ